MNNLIEQSTTDHKLTVSEFAARMKKKYPVYKDMEDTELVNKIIVKYPTYKNYIDFQQPIVAKQNSGPDPKDVNSYPACVREFGNPTAGKNGLYSIDGTGQYKGMFFFYNGRYVHEKTIKTYTCGSDGQTLTIETPITTQLPTGKTRTSKSKLLNYIACSKLPCKFGTKNEKIREIQTCIGFPLKYQTGNFGPITRQGLMDLQIDVSNGITDQIYNDIMTNCGSSLNPEPPIIVPNVDPEKTASSDKIPEV